MTTVEVLRKARALYEANPSHVPGGQQPKEPRVCVVTAVVTACNHRLLLAGDEAEAAVCDAAGISLTELVDWNAKSTTEEVLAAFDRAIEASS